jgi:hypothetical protein
MFARWTMSCATITKGQTTAQPVHRVNVEMNVTVSSNSKMETYQQRIGAEFDANIEDVGENHKREEREC